MGCSGFLGVNKISAGSSSIDLERAMLLIAFGKTHEETWCTFL